MAQNDREHFAQRLAELERQSRLFKLELAQLKEELLRSDLEAAPDQGATSLSDPLATVPGPPRPAPVPEPPPAPSDDDVGRRDTRADIEFWLGGRGLLLLGVAALVLAVGFFVKEAMERGWIGPTMRVLLGAGVGVAAVIAGERIRAFGYRTYGLWLAAGGFGATYLSIWAATVLYFLVPTSVGFVLMVAVVLAAAFLGLIRDSESFVALAALGGYLAPLLLQVETGSTVFSLGYLGLLTAAALGVAHRAGWPRLAALAVTGGSVLALASEGDPHLHAVYLVALIAAALAIARRRRWPAVSLLAVALGWIVFWIGSGGWEISGVTFSAYAAAIWLVDLIASVGVTDWVSAPGAADGGAEPGPAADQLALRQETHELAVELCGLGVTLLPPWLFFLSAMSGLEESAWRDQSEEIGIVLASLLGAVYLAQAVRGRPGRGAGSRLWRAGLGFAFWLVAPRVLWEQMGVVRAWLVQGVAFALAGVGLKRAGVRAAGVAAFTLAILTYLGSVAARPTADAAFFGGWALTGLAASVGLALSALALEIVELPASWEKGLRPVLLLAAAVFFLGWGTGEILRFFDLKAEGDPERWKLVRDVSISTFWMLYAAALLVVGFWLERPPVRWVGLGMALIAAAKVFLYDLSNLSQLYRILSFVLLAVVLLALSFRYQKLRGGGGGQPGTG